ncbi:16S rRNA (guanine(527)-N(7))-methyltransferase RsmG [Weissella diestrammenae]|uniref:Ribosomal RNA small subunit methyltransferase G n=1 Tax=Weissella diestrammenae TaxID=1162633 RepID=A0A7G9T746_9LACO|nr:16S rRNA (guanine(527)-N(7))-methyltransferase RsmG [Weissella diestrammenae]MCM0582479.1 16S rRNA (guanine(527)-N(7))-methyltransferase RsmG [Weissella diestrammenae]QNN75921.1 16S rRNA (guanine(527)-N(7))-methyltransferase RsmG [Weissella diestrammenae]
MNPAEFVAALAEKGVVLSERQITQYQIYYDYLVEVNAVMDLTNIIAQDDVYLKHFFDSLTLAWAYPELTAAPLKMVDVGAGAGFPSIPLKIAFPQLEITIIDSLQKRIRFLNQLIEKLGLTGVTAVHGRAEEFGKAKADTRESFDVATARALKAMPMLAELTLPLVKVNGVLLAMKGSRVNEELVAAKNAIPQLGGQVVNQVAVNLPNGDPREIVVIKKITQTPTKYPRKFSDIKNKTL